MITAPASRQVPGERRLVGRHEPVEGQRAARGRHVGGVDVVLERDRYAVQRAAYLALRAFAIERLGLFERIAIYGDGRMQLVLVEPDSDEVLLYQLPRRDAPLLHGGLHLRDGGFHHAKRGAPAPPV